MMENGEIRMEPNKYLPVAHQQRLQSYMGFWDSYGESDKVIY
jgi:hypothetical protein